MAKTMTRRNCSLIKANLVLARKTWPNLSREAGRSLADIVRRHAFSIAAGDLLYLDNHWYVTTTGLLGLARRSRCNGIHVRPLQSFCDPDAQRWAFEATVYKSRTCRGFSGYGDANPSNVSSLVRGAEMRVAETRAVNRALRKAYGIGICSVEELGSANSTSNTSAEVRRPPQSSNGNGWGSGPRVRDRLCQLIRQHQLDPELVKAYAVDFCGTKTLKDATRAQIEAFVEQLADWAERDRNALLCQLNSYIRVKESQEPKQEGAA